MEKKMLSSRTSTQKVDLKKNKPPILVKKQAKSNKEAEGLNPSDKKGVSDPTPLKFDQHDAVNLFNGNLTANIPIGIKFPVGGILSYQLGLIYNSKIWKIKDHSEPNDPKPYVFTDILPLGNAGLGWQIGFEHLYAPGETPDNEAPLNANWMMVAKDGSQHHFYTRFRPKGIQQSDANGKIRWTQDGSFMRMKNLPNGKMIESPNGISRIFRHDGKIAEIRDPFGNYLRFSYPNRFKTILTDRHGRSHQVTYKNFTDPSKNGTKKPLVTEIRLAAFGGKTAVYKLDIKEEIIKRHYKDTQSPSDQIKVPLLRGVSLPDGSSYRIDYYKKNEGVAFFNNSPLLKNGGVSGLMKNFTIPTGGKYEYKHGTFSIPNNGGVPVPGDTSNSIPGFSHNDGIVEKRIISAKNKLLGTWKYHSLNILNEGFPVGNQPEKIKCIVTDPEGNDTVNFFYVKAFDWKHGAPFSIYHRIGNGSNTMYLSKQIYKGPAKNRKLKRSIYVRYTADEGARMGNGNRRLRLRRVIFHDDGNRYIETQKTKYDGYGHFRHSMTISNFGKKKYTFQNFNPAYGIYDYDIMTGKTLLPNTFKMFSQHNPWVLHTFKVFDKWQEGMSNHARTKYYFEWSKGFLLGKRIFKGKGRSQNDVLQVFERDRYGNQSREKHYGGDLQNISTLNNFDRLLQALGKPVYQINHIYKYGTLRSSQYFDTSTNKLLPFKSVDLDIDKNTGLASVSRDISGLVTYLEYDSSGRLEWVKPIGGSMAFTNHFYSVAPGKVFVYTRKIDNSLSGKPLQSYAYIRYDDFGRVWKENTAIQLIPVQKIATKEIRYNAMGWKTFEYNRRIGRPFHKTSFKSFDAFGRPREIIRPDGEKTAIEYKGIRQIKRTVRVGTGRKANGGIILSPSISFEIYDAHKRLVEVREPTGRNGQALSTFYTYNQADQLIEVQQKGGSLGIQKREFHYDNRGFLLNERHPEKGSSNGNAWVKHRNFDAKGHAHKQEDGANKLTFVFDKAERLIKVKKYGGQLLKEFKYAQRNSGANKQKGKIQEAIRYNYGTIPWSGQTYTIRVQENYVYAGRNGLVSQKTTTIPVGSAPYEFVQKYDYTPLGDTSTITYPNALHEASGNHFRKVKYLYNAGLLSAVQEIKANGQALNYAKAITYHANGLLHKIKHGNGTIYTMDNDPHDMIRPKMWHVKAPVGELQMGPYHYDGQGNITRIDIPSRKGYEDFIYDQASRLLQHGTDEKRYQKYQYDAFGNMTKMVTRKNNGQVITRNISINAKTNRLKNTSYDSSGNQLKSILSGASYSYDAFNMIRRLQTPHYDIVHLYTVDEERVWTVKMDKFSPPNNRVIENTFSLRNLKGQLLRQYKVSSEDMSKWILQRDYIHRGKTLLASYSPGEGIRHYHPDHLGTPIPITGESGGLAGWHFYHAFGEEVSNPNGDNIPLKFTGHERDQDLLPDPLDYMHARFYSPLIGKFLSVDPAKSWNLKNPQTWNRYTYALNNPVKYIDPDGLISRSTIADATIATGEVYATIKGVKKFFNGAPGKSLIRNLNKAKAGAFGAARALGASSRVAAGAAGTTGAVGTGSLILGAATGGYAIGTVLDEKTAVGDVADKVVEWASDLVSKEGDVSEAEANETTRKAEEALAKARKKNDEIESELKEFEDKVKDLMNPD